MRRNCSEVEMGSFEDREWKDWACNCVRRWEFEQGRWCSDSSLPCPEASPMELEQKASRRVVDPDDGSSGHHIESHVGWANLSKWWYRLRMALRKACVVL